MSPKCVNMIVDPALPRILIGNWLFAPVKSFILCYQDQVIIKYVLIYTIHFAVSTKVGIPPLTTFAQLFFHGNAHAVQALCEIRYAGNHPPWGSFKIILFKIRRDWLLEFHDGALTASLDYFFQVFFCALTY